jgi:catechol 2,3-dioxygenase-like lactoylglutathione lyase family enzyme
MKIALHHINICSPTSVPKLREFYQSILDLAPATEGEHTQIVNHGYDSSVAFLTDGTTEFHLAPRDLGVSYRTNQPINPLERGHIAFRTDDIEAFKERLRDKNIPFADYGEWAMAGWYQIFFQDPEGTIIEVHQADYKKP